MKIQSLLCFVVLSVAAVAIAAQKPAPLAQGPATAPSTQPAAANKTPVNKFCAVEQDNPVDDRIPTLEYNGMTIGFCCPDCEAIFKKDPDKYLATMH